MHVDQMPRAGRLVQPVDVLGDGEHAAMRPFEARERGMRGVRLGQLQPAPAHVVELVHLDGVAGEALGRRHLLEVEMIPQPVLAAERAERALGREPGARQDDDS